MSSADDVAARVRAARSYAGLTAPQLASELNISKETLSRLENGRRPASRDELETIASATGVPLPFLLGGFSAEESDLPERVQILERQMETLLQIIARRAISGAATTAREARPGNLADAEGSGRSGR